MNVLSIVPFHNSVVSVAYEWIIFHLESNISAVNVVNDKNNFSGYLGSHYSQRNQWWNYQEGSLGYQCNQCSQKLSFLNTHSWKCVSHVNYFFNVVSTVNVVSVASNGIIFM